MSKQLIFVIGVPYSGRTTWINKNLYNSEDSVVIDANDYPNLYVKSEKKDSSKLYEDTIEDSRKWCLEQVKLEMELESPPQKIILSLIACRPDRWREFIELAIEKEYELLFKFPSNKLLFYITKHNTSLEQFKFIDSKTLNRYPRDKKEIEKKNAKGQFETTVVDSNESSLLRYVVTETESAHSFYLSNRNTFFNDKTQLLAKINEHYKVVILSEVKKAEKKAKDTEREAEKKARDLEKELKKLEKDAVQEVQQEVQEVKEVVSEEVQQEVKEVVSEEVSEEVQVVQQVQYDNELSE
jgi:hypothetical protein